MQQQKSHKSWNDTNRYHCSWNHLRVCFIQKLFGNKPNIMRYSIFALCSADTSQYLDIDFGIYEEKEVEQV
jgi:hypothetical protein